MSQLVGLWEQTLALLTSTAESLTCCLSTGRGTKRLKPQFSNTVVGWCLFLVPLKHREGTARRGVDTGQTIPVREQAITKTNPLPLGLFLRGFLAILALSTNINHIPCPGHLCWEQSSAPEVRSAPSLSHVPSSHSRTCELHGSL